MTHNETECEVQKQLLMIKVQHSENSTGQVSLVISCIIIRLLEQTEKTYKLELLYLHTNPILNPSWLNIDLRI